MAVGAREADAASALCPVRRKARTDFTGSNTSLGTGYLATGRCSPNGQGMNEFEDASSSRRRGVSPRWLGREPVRRVAGWARRETGRSPGRPCRRPARSRAAWRSCCALGSLEDFFISNRSGTRRRRKRRGRVLGSVLGDLPRRRTVKSWDRPIRLGRCEPKPRRGRRFGRRGWRQGKRAAGAFRCALLRGEQPAISTGSRGPRVCKEQLSAEPAWRKMSLVRSLPSGAPRSTSLPYSASPDV